MHLKKNITIFFVIGFIVSGTFLVQQCKPNETAAVPLSRWRQCICRGPAM